MDWGLARRIEHQPAGLTMGTLLYASPEQLTGYNADQVGMHWVQCTGYHGCIQGTVQGGASANACRPGYKAWHQHQPREQQSEMPTVFKQAVRLKLLCVLIAPMYSPGVGPREAGTSCGRVGAGRHAVRDACGQALLTHLTR